MMNRWNFSFLLLLFFSDNMLFTGHILWVIFCSSISAIIFACSFPISWTHLLSSHWNVLHWPIAVAISYDGFCWSFRYDNQYEKITSISHYALIGECDVPFGFTKGRCEFDWKWLKLLVWFLWTHSVIYAQVVRVEQKQKWSPKVKRNDFHSTS